MAASEKIMIDRETLPPSGRFSKYYKRVGSGAADMKPEATEGKKREEVWGKWCKSKQYCMHCEPFGPPVLCLYYKKET